MSLKFISSLTVWSKHSGIHLDFGMHCPITLYSHPQAWKMRNFLIIVIKRAKAREDWGKKKPHSLGKNKSICNILPRVATVLLHLSNGNYGWRSLPGFRHEQCVYWTSISDSWFRDYFEEVAGPVVFPMHKRWEITNGENMEKVGVIPFTRGLKKKKKRLSLRFFKLHIPVGAKALMGAGTVI